MLQTKLTWKISQICTKDSLFTWSNCRHLSGLVERRLDRAFCNQIWLTTSTTMNVSTLTKLRLDHYSLLLEARFSQHKHVSHFGFFGIWTLHDKYEDLIINCWYVPVIGSHVYILIKKL